MVSLPSIRVPGLAAVVLGVALSLLGGGAASGGPGDPQPVGVWPLQPTPEVVAGFDPPQDPYGAGHRGVDLAGRVGQPVRAALAGRVTYAGPLAGRGVVVVGHGPTRTTYEPVGAEVGVGDHVSAGERIGVLQLPGSHCFPSACLHWGWIEGATYLDPLLLVGGGPVRLLSLRGAGPDSVPTVTTTVGRAAGPGGDAIVRSR
ncbi:peptidoglycan DD-metalloendopeptidase family protein [Nocardioides sp. 503]|uniref:M23 family metallopeptidase n=1 Tax=Nocardioides sp. 503 TaxID=2508326 RepID=UPI00106F9442|nr:peptidoglycan DD-metalloendopeptidase family protein [Nocardioides sp. 503]